MDFFLSLDPTRIHEDTRNLEMLTWTGKKRKGKKQSYS